SPRGIEAASVGGTPLGTRASLDAIRVPGYNGLEIRLGCFAGVPMRKCVVLPIVAILAVAAAGAFTPADAKPAGGKKGTKGTQQQQYLQIKMQDAPISSYRTAPSTGNSTGRPSGASRR